MCCEGVSFIGGCMIGVWASGCGAVSVMNCVSVSESIVTSIQLSSAIHNESLCSWHDDDG